MCLKPSVNHVIKWFNTNYVEAWKLSCLQVTSLLNLRSRVQRCGLHRTLLNSLHEAFDKLQEELRVTGNLVVTTSASTYDVMAAVPGSQSEQLALHFLLTTSTCFHLWSLSAFATIASSLAESKCNCAVSPSPSAASQFEVPAFFLGKTQAGPWRSCTLSSHWVGFKGSGTADGNFLLCGRYGACFTQKCP